MEEKNKMYIEKFRSALSGVNFPITKDEIIQKKGDARVEVAAGKNVSIRDALKPVSTSRFQNANEVINEVSEAHKLGWPEM